MINANLSKITIILLNMGRNGKQTKSTIAEVVARRSTRGMRQKIQGSLGNTTLLRGTELLTALSITGTNTGTTALVPLIAGTSESRAVFTFINVAKNFQKFLYLPGTHMRYQPNVGLNTAGTIYIAYVDNPEIVKDYNAASASVRADIVKGMANMKSYPLWQEFTHHIGPPRLKSFSTDVTTDFSDADTLNRVMQGTFLIAIEGVIQTATTTYGRIALQNVLRLEELSSTSPT